MNIRKHVLLLSLFLFFLLSSSLSAQKRLYVEGGASFLWPADKNYQNAYGKSTLLPEFNIGVRLFSRFCLFAGYSSLSDTGKIPDLDIDAKSKQKFYTCGAGFWIPVASKLSIRADGGIAYINYSEELLDIKINSNKMGYYLEGILQVSISKSFYLGGKAGYIFGKDKYEDVDFKLGGPKAAVFIGMALL